MTVAVIHDPERIAYANELRKLVSPPKAVNQDGSLNQEFFKPEKVLFVQEKTWGKDERDRLYEGLEKYGVGEWSKIKEELLPKWDSLQLRVKTSRLLGSQSVARYTGQKFTKEQLDTEYAMNKELGLKTGCWKAGVVVEDDYGNFALALKEHQEADK